MKKEISLKEKLYQSFNRVEHNYAIYELNLMHQESPDGLSFNSLQYLKIIFAYPGKYTVSNLADMLCVARPAVTQKINELEKINYIYKKQSDKDKRVFYLYPTKQFEDIVQKKDEQIFKIIMDKYSEEELDKYCEIAELFAELYANVSNPIKEKK